MSDGCRRGAPSGGRGFTYHPVHHLFMRAFRTARRIRLEIDLVDYCCAMYNRVQNNS